MRTGALFTGMCIEMQVVRTDQKHGISMALPEHLFGKTWYLIGLRLGLRMDFLLCPILRPNILGHILFK